MTPIKSLHPQVVMISPGLLLQLALESGVITAVIGTFTLTIAYRPSLRTERFCHSQFANIGSLPLH
jgi:hypothetical protein